MSSADTIFALSTGRLPSGVAIVRLTGPRVRFVFETMVGHVPTPRVAAYSHIGRADTVIDRGLALFFPAPHSVTGEDCGELHVHGSPAVVKALLTILSDLPGLRPAEPGEFTRRAFLNGKLDLTGVEALSDLIAAETEQQRRLAIENSGERQRDAYLDWRARILRLRALVEADLDFSDQEDVPDTVTGEVAAEATAISGEIDAHVALFRRSEIVREGYSVVIIGAPNAGKSSLLNALAQREAVIVSDEAGTTRDAITVAIDINGYKVNLTDTAGLRDDPGRIEAMGIERALDLAAKADLVLRLTDMTDPVWVRTAGKVLDVGTKADLAYASNVHALAVSSWTGVGLDDLLLAIAELLTEAVGTNSHVAPTRERHVRHLRAAATALSNAAGGGLPELRAEELRVAAVELGRIVGLSDTEELLGEIFSRFCIGK